MDHADTLILTTLTGPVLLQSFPFLCTWTREERELTACSVPQHITPVPGWLGTSKLNQHLLLLLTGFNCRGFVACLFGERFVISNLAVGSCWEPADRHLGHIRERSSRVVALKAQLVTLLIVHVLLMLLFLLLLLWRTRWDLL